MVYTHCTQHNSLVIDDGMAHLLVHVASQAEARDTVSWRGGELPSTVQIAMLSDWT